ASPAVTVSASLIGPTSCRSGGLGPGGGLEDGADLGRERADVVGGDGARAVGLAVADRLEEGAVLAHALAQVRQAVEHEVPDAQRQVEVPRERLLEVRVR